MSSSTGLLDGNGNEGKPIGTSFSERMDVDSISTPQTYRTVEFDDASSSSPSTPSTPTPLCDTAHPPPTPMLPKPAPFYPPDPQKHPDGGAPKSEATPFDFDDSGANLDSETITGTRKGKKRAVDVEFESILDDAIEKHHHVDLGGEGNRMRRTGSVPSDNPNLRTKTPAMRRSASQKHVRFVLPPRDEIYGEELEPSPRPSMEDSSTSAIEMQSLPVSALSELRLTHNEDPNGTGGEDEWDRVSHLRDASLARQMDGMAATHSSGSFADDSDFTSPITFIQVVRRFRKGDYSKVRDSIEVELKESGAPLGFLFCCGRPPKLQGEVLLEERELVFCYAKTPLDEEDSVHMRMLRSIYRMLTGNHVYCPRIGSHWETLGFQGNDPSTDLRGTGIYSLLQMLFVLCEWNDLAMRLYNAFQRDFAVVSINVTSLCLHLLRAGVFNRICNRTDSVCHTMDECFAATFHMLMLRWTRGTFTIEDFYDVLKAVEQDVRDHTDLLLDRFHAAMAERGHHPQGRAPKSGRVVSKTAQFD
jgi:ELMO domain-containing protein